MKKNILAVFLTLTVLIAGVQTAFAQTDPAPARGNAAPLEMLPEDLQKVDVKDYYITAAARPAGSIRTVVGHVVVLHEDTGQAYFAAAGDALFKHDAVFTLKDSRCRLKFTTDDIITMGDNARIGLEEYIDDRVQKKKTSVFSMLRGKAMFYALRLFKYRTSSSSVKTPTAIIGVRGTQFGVEVRKVGDKMASSRPVYLADASDSGFKYLLSQIDPAQFEVITHCFEGIIDTVSLIDNITTVLTQGQSQEITDAGAGDTFSTPDDVAVGFTQATAVPDPEAALDEGQKTAPAPAAAVTTPAAGDTGAADPTDTTITDNILDIVQSTTTIAQETQGKPRQGYFSGMLIDHDSGFLLDDVYVSSTRQDFNSAVITANGIFNTSGYIKGNTDFGFSIANPTLKQVKVSSTSITADNLGLPVTKGSIGSNDYMEWGYWYVANTFKVVVSGASEIDHNLYHKGYYIAGAPTPDANVAGISGDYSGKAWGTYYEYSSTSSSPKGIDMVGMEGDFNCYVNGTTGTISGFNMSVSGGTKSASISGASGSFNSSSFDISGGSWLLDGSAPVYKSCHGSLYGPNGEHIGGAWGMKLDQENAAQGIFQGKKQ